MIAAQTYLARLIAVVDLPPHTNGLENWPRLGWRFKILGPPGSAAIGQIIEQATGRAPGEGSGLVRLLKMLLAKSGGLQTDSVVRLDTLLGRLYRLRWAKNPESKRGWHHIANLVEV